MSGVPSSALFALIAFFLLLVLTALGLFFSHESCWEAQNEPDFTSGKIGWVFTVSAAFLTLCALVFALTHIDDSRHINKLVLFSAILVIATGVCLYYMYDPCFNGTTKQRTAWVIAAVGIVLQLLIIMAIFPTYYRSIKLHYNEDNKPLKWAKKAFQEDQREFRRQQRARKMGKPYKQRTSARDDFSDRSDD